MKPINLTKLEQLKDNVRDIGQCLRTLEKHEKVQFLKQP